MKRAALTYQFEEKIGPYADALREVGIEPVFITPDTAPNTFEGVDGLVLSGGTDLNAGLYGQTRDLLSEEPDDARDAMEVRLLREALARDVPVFAICRGMQLLNVVHRGGTLIQHIEGHAVRTADLGAPAHSVSVERGTLLSSILGSGLVPVNSRHHQAVSQIGEGLVVTARSGDGVVEAIESPGARFVLGVQWHPENQIYAFAGQRQLFEVFAETLRRTATA